MKAQGLGVDGCRILHIMINLSQSMFLQPNYWYSQVSEVQCGFGTEARMLRMGSVLGEGEDPERVPPLSLGSRREHGASGLRPGRKSLR